MRDALCPSVVSFNSVTPRAQSFIIVISIRGKLGNGKVGNGKLGDRKIRQPCFGGVGKFGNGKMGNGKVE